jgi:hypothetical protein
MTRRAASLLSACTLACAATAHADSLTLEKPTARVSARDGELTAYAIDLPGAWALGETRGRVVAGVAGSGTGDPTLWSRWSTRDGQLGLKWAGDTPQADLGATWKVGVGLLPEKHFVSLAPTLDWTPEGEALSLRSELKLEGLPAATLQVQRDRWDKRRAAAGVTARVTDDFGLRLEAGADVDTGAADVSVRLVR